MTIIIDEVSIPEFSKDFDKLCKKYHHFKEDFERAKRVLISQPIMHDAPRISNLGKNVILPIYKLKKFYSDDFKGKGKKSGFRIIYAYDEEKEKITLVEVYHKNKQSNHDIARIKKYFEIKDLCS
jgi:mRNA-degrading endonuclease RelE of RelBE toxin-antitoxin system